MADITTTLTTALASASGDIMSVVGVGLAAGIGIMGLFLAIRAAMKAFKSVAK